MKLDKQQHVYILDILEPRSVTLGGAREILEFIKEICEIEQDRAKSASQNIRIGDLVNVITDAIEAIAKAEGRDE